MHCVSSWFLWFCMMSPKDMVGHFSFLGYVSTELPSTCCCIVFASGFLPVFGLHELDNKIKQIMAALSFTDVTCSCAVCPQCILLTGDFSHFPCQASGWQSLRAAFFFNSVYTAVKCPVLSPLFGDTCSSWIVNLNQLMAKWGLALYYICMFTHFCNSCVIEAVIRHCL